MGEVSVPQQEIHVLAAPSICAKSGSPAQENVSIRLTWTPGWIWLLIIFGLFPFIIVYHFTKMTIDIEIPISDEVAQQRFRFRLRMVAAFVGTLALAIGGASTEVLALMVVGVVLMIAVALTAQIGGMRLWIDARFDSGDVHLARVNSNYVAAVESLRTRL